MKIKENLTKEKLKEIFEISPTKSIMIIVCLLLFAYALYTGIKTGWLFILGASWLITNMYQEWKQIKEGEE